MNKAFIIIAFSTLLLSCIGKHNSDAQKVTVTNKNSNPIKTIKGDTIQIDPVKSNIYWKGTKMRGAGKHEGKIALKNGHFIMENIYFKRSICTELFALLAKKYKKRSKGI